MCTGAGEDGCFGDWVGGAGLCVERTGPEDSDGFGD